MNCFEFEAILDEILDSRELHLPERAGLHRSHCAACDQKWRDYCVLEEALRAGFSVEAPASLSRRVLNALIEKVEPQVGSEVTRCVPQPQKRFGHWVVVATSAACLFLAAIIAMRHPGERGNRPLAATGSLPERATEIVDDLSPDKVSTSVASLMDELKVEYYVLADETAAVAKDFVSVLPEPTVTSVPAVKRDEGGGFSQASAVEIGRSVGDQIGKAMGFLWQTIPGDGSSG